MAGAEWVSGNVFIRPNPLEKAGDRVDGHTHNFDHTTIVFKGAIHVKAKLPDGTVIERDFRAPAHCLIRADVEHEITNIAPSEADVRAELESLSREDLIARIVAHEAGSSVFWCVYSHRDPQGRITQQYTGWEKANT